MENKIREYVIRKFSVYPNTKKMIEFRDKILSMMVYKYRDCQYYGMSKQKSYAMAISVLNNFSQEQKKYSELCLLFGGIA